MIGQENPLSQPITTTAARAAASISTDPALHVRLVRPTVTHVVAVASSATSGPLMMRARKMQVGDLVKFRPNGESGLVIVVPFPGGDTYRVQWLDGNASNHHRKQLEVISASR